MKITTKVRATLIAAAVIAGVGAATGGVALAATDPSSPTSAEQSTPVPQDNTAVLNQMDTMMQQMVQQMPADQRAAATQLHEQMRPNMQKMLAGGMSGMGQMNSTHSMTG